MKVTRRSFVKGGVAAFTYSFAAPAILCRMAQAQGQSSRSLVVLDLTGGNDSLSMLVPYNDSFYYSRRPTLAVPAGNVLQVGSDSSGKALGLHPRLTGLKDIFNQGRLAFIQRTGYENSSRSHFMGTDIWSTANPTNSQGPGWLGKYLDSLGGNQDPLVGWNTFSQTPHARPGQHRGRAFDSRPGALRLLQPEHGRRCRARAIDNGQDCVARARGTATDFVCGRRRGRRHGDAGSRGHRGHLRAERGVPEQRPRPGVEGRRRRDGERHGHQDFLGADRRLRYALRAAGQPDQRQLHEPDGDAQRRPDRLLQRPDQPGA